MKQLAYVQEQQEETCWCWVAVACSVATYRKDARFTQCNLAGRVLGRQTCCASSSSCNEPGSLEEALAAASHLAGPPTGPVPLSTLQRQINLDLPVGIRVERFDETAHVMAIIGYDDGVDDACRLEIRDPWSGRDEVAYGQLRHGTYSYGRWSHTYFTS